MYIEPMALTGSIKICIICKGFCNWLFMYCFGDPSTGNWCDGWHCHKPALV